MKKILPAFLLLTFLVFPVLVSAQPAAPTATAPTIFTSGQSMIDLLDVVANWAFVILMSLAAIMLIFGGMKFINARGKSEDVTAARDLLIWALVGVAVGVAAKGLVAVVRSILGG